MTTLIFKPFEKYSDKTLLIIGVISTIVGSFMSSTFNARFDGVLDLHFGNSLTLSQAFQDNLINNLCLFLFLFISAKYINRKTRLIDILTTALIARIPYYFLPLLNVNNVISNATEKITQLENPELISQISASSWGIIAAFSIVSILTMVWYIALLFNGFKVASNAKGKVPIVLFILSLLLAEILSKILIYQFD